MTFGTRLTKYRELAGYKQKELAEKLGITPTRLNYWEKDKREPDVEMIKLLSSVLGVSTDRLIGIDLPAPALPTLTQSEDELIANYRHLNEDGQGRLSDYASDLVASGRYRRE